MNLCWWWWWCVWGFCGIEEKNEKREEGEISVDAAMRCAGGMNRKSRGKGERERERDRRGGDVIRYGRAVEGSPGGWGA